MVNYEFERDFYEVYTEDGSKYIHILGWIEERDDHIMEIATDSRSFYKVGERPDDITFPDLTCHYGHDYEWDEEKKVIDYAKTYFDGKPGTHLPLREVTDNTPDGNYWCYFEEE